jgi:hypothetical protein
MRETSLVLGAPSSLVPASHSSSASSGADELRVKLADHTSSGPELTAGDVDAGTRLEGAPSTRLVSRMVRRSRSRAGGLRAGAAATGTAIRRVAVGLTTFMAFREVPAPSAPVVFAACLTIDFFVVLAFGATGFLEAFLRVLRVTGFVAFFAMTLLARVFFGTAFLRTAFFGMAFLGPAFLRLLAVTRDFLGARGPVRPACRERAGRDAFAADRFCFDAFFLAMARPLGFLDSAL